MGIVRDRRPTGALGSRLRSVVYLLLLAAPWSVRMLAALTRPFGLRIEVVASPPPGEPCDGLLVPGGPAICAPVTTPAGRVDPPAPIRRFPDVGYRVLTDAMVIPGVAGAVAGGAAHRRAPIWPDEHGLSSEVVPMLRAHRGGRGLVAWRETTVLDEAVFLGGRATPNWYHWLNDTLPRLWLTDRLPPQLRELPLLLDAVALAVPTVRETVERYRRGRIVLTAPSFKPVRVRRLVIVDGIARAEPAAGFSGEFEAPATRALHAAAAREYRTDLMARLGVEDTDAPDGPRLYITRAPGSRRVFNHDEVRRALVAAGFTALDPSELSAADQARAFRCASLIVGPSGAAMANLLFAAAPTRALFWGSAESLSTQAIWANLAAVGGASVTMLPVSPRNRYHLDPSEVLARIDG